MLIIHSFVRNEHTCLLPDDANFSPRLPFQFWIVCKKFYSGITQSAECLPVKQEVQSSNLCPGAKFDYSFLNADLQIDVPMRLKIFSFAKTKTVK